MANLARDLQVFFLWMLHPVGWTTQKDLAKTESLGTEDFFSLETTLNRNICRVTYKQICLSFIFYFLFHFHFYLQLALLRVGDTREGGGWR